MSYSLEPANPKTILQFFVLLLVISITFSIVGASLISIALCLPHTPYKTVENPIINQIYREMGPFQTFYNRTSNENISLTEVREIGEENALSLEIVRMNGTAVFKKEACFLFFRYNNGTAYQVNCEQTGISLNLFRLRFKLEYQHTKENLITRIDGDYSEPYYSVHQLSIVEYPEAVATQIWNNFVVYFKDSLLMFSLLGNFIAIILAVIFFTARYLGWLFCSSWLNYFILKRLHGKLGKKISRLPFINFKGDWFLEEKFESEINFSTVRKTFKEIFKERWYDTLVFPTALAAVLIYVLLALAPKIPLKINLLYSSPLIAPIVIFVLIFYYPLIWSFDEGRFKQIIKSHEKDIKSVSSLGTITKRIFGVLIGLSGILTLGTVALSLTGVAYETEFGSVDDIIQAIDLIGGVMLVLWTIGLFLVLMSSMLTGVGSIAIIYLTSYHIQMIEYLRNQSAEDKIITQFGSLKSILKSTPSNIIYPTENSIESS